MATGIDTNVLLRAMWDMDQDSAQMQRARNAFEDADRPLVINLIVLVEAVWTLEKLVGRRSPIIINGLQSLLSLSSIKIERRELVEGSLNAYALGGPGFSDHLIGALNASIGCQTTFTFDKRAAKLDTFTEV